MKIGDDSTERPMAHPSPITRRSLLVSLGAVAAAPHLLKWPLTAASFESPLTAASFERPLAATSFERPLTAADPAQARPQTLKLRELNHFALFVADGERSKQFYQGLFGMPVQALQGNGGNLLKVGTGMEYIALAGVGAGRKSGFIDHFSINLESYNADNVFAALGSHGVSKGDPGTAPMTAWLRMRGPAQGGAPDGTGELYFNDPDGIKGQVQDPTYCGGGGALGNLCPALDIAPPPKGPITLRGLNHLTLTTANIERSAQFYRGAFGMPVLGRQGPAYQLRIGSGPQFIAIAGGPDAKPAIGHFCMTMDNFDPDRVMKILADHGVPKGEPGKTPMTAWVRMRGPELGGAPGGTPELYFNDPDGITVQLQDVTYCGGAGALGNVCK